MADVNNSLNPTGDYPYPNLNPSRANSLLKIIKEKTKPKFKNTSNMKMKENIGIVYPGLCLHAMLAVNVTAQSKHIEVF